MRSRGITRTLAAALVVATAVLLIAAAGGSGAPAGEPAREASAAGDSASAAEARTARRRARCRGRGRPRSRIRRRDCRDLRIGKPERPRRQRYHGKRIPVKGAGRCDILDRSVCLQPFPNDRFTAAASTPTGRRVNLKRASMPANAAGTRIDPTDFNRADGFSPGQLIVTKVPGLVTPAALNRTNPVRLTNLAAYANKRTPVVVINARTRQRHPIWVELDMSATNPKDRNLLIRPAVNFAEGTRYIVALRNLRRPRGKLIRPQKVFRLYRDRLITRQKPIERRRKKMEGLFRRLKRSGIRRGNLYRAWDFTVASSQTLAGRVLAMRNEAFANLNDANLANQTVEGDPPTFAITDVLQAVDCTGACDQPNEADDALRVIQGTVEAPCYLSHPNPAAVDECDPGAQFAFSGPNDLTPDRIPGATTDVPFRCVIPDSVVIAGPDIDEARPSIVGHGLLGDRGIINQTAFGANKHNFVNCAMNWDGFSSADIGATVLPSLTDLSNFPKIADAVQQAFLNKLLMGRAMIHPGGFADDPAFQIDPTDPEDVTPGPGDEPVIDTERLFYWGVSHGGIMGGALTALAPDHQRAVLNVPAMNHSTLLLRSIHWDTFGPFFNTNYTRPLERMVILSAVQMLWDRAENNGYAHHIAASPYPNTPPHTVLMQVAYGDHQVTNYAAEVMARTIGARALTPALDPGRHWDVNPLFRIPAVPSVPFAGSAMVYWDGGPVGFPGDTGPGTAPPPLISRPPRAADGFGGDPHGYILNDPEGRLQLSDFLRVGGTLQNCGGDPPPCYSNGFPGAP